MNINKNGYKPLVRFSELKPGDVFYRAGSGDGDFVNRYFMKTLPVLEVDENGVESLFTAVKLANGSMSCINDERFVIPIRAELVVEAVGVMEEGAE